MFRLLILVWGFTLVAGAASYLDLMEIAVGAYDDQRIEAYVREAETRGVEEHGFPRLAANLARLVASGRMTERRELLSRMLTVACASAGKGPMPPRSGGNEFSVRELVSAVMALEKAKVFPLKQLEAWKEDLRRVNANRDYTWAGTNRLGGKVGHNWPLFGAASEQARIYYHLGGDAGYVEAWVGDQLRHFDENGMYRDPHEPAVYDFIGRMCYMLILHFGYAGRYRSAVEQVLEKSAEPTLSMLSVCGEIPFGGRSNQFLHNHTMYAAVAEWYAGFFARRGDAVKAARFRAAANRAIAAMEPWLEARPLHHVKNLYPPPHSSNARNVEQRWFGCEPYAYFDKYMVTMASWAAIAGDFSSNLQEVQPIQVDQIVQSFQTSRHFHWKFVHSANYTVQEDWQANSQYDATGVGRIHRRGAPAAICLSAPFAARPNYFIGGGVNPGPLAITGWKEYAVTDAGVCFKCEGNRLTLPAFEFDGTNATELNIKEQTVEIRYQNWVCRYVVSGGRFVDTHLKYHNRNGRYRRIDAEGNGPFSVTVTIDRFGACWYYIARSPDGE